MVSKSDAASRLEHLRLRRHKETEAKVTQRSEDYRTLDWPIELNLCHKRAATRTHGFLRGEPVAAVSPYVRVEHSHRCRRGQIAIHGEFAFDFGSNMFGP